MTSKLFAPVVPLTPESLASVRAKRTRDRRRLAIALAVRSPFVLGSYLLGTVFGPYLAGCTSKAYYAGALLGFVTLWRLYLYLDAFIARRVFTDYESLIGVEGQECEHLLKYLPEGAQFRAEVLTQGRFFTRLELEHIRQRVCFLYQTRPDVLAELSAGLDNLDTPRFA